MLTRWLTFTAFLAGSAHAESSTVGRGTLTVAPTCRVKGQPEAALTLNCGDGKKTGVVQYWHTPFGDLQTPSFQSKLDPVFMYHDGSLVVPNTSILHSGVYYCLLRHTEGATLWPYELHVGHNDQKTQEHSEYEQCDALRFRRDVGSVEERQAGVTDGQFAGAVAASVLLTFVMGFSAGALTRSHVLRCLAAVATRLRSPRRQRGQTDMPVYDSEVNMTTLPPMYDNRALAQEWDDDGDDKSANSASMETTISSTTSSPPAKPQRSFRQKRQEEQVTTAYLEGCDYMEEEAAERSLKEEDKGCDGEAEEKRTFSGFYLLGKEEGSQTETDEDRCSDDVEERERREEKSREEKTEWRQEEEAGAQENRSKADGEKRGSEERKEEVDDGEKRSKEDGEKRGREEERKQEVDDGEKRSKKDGEKREREEERKQEVDDGEKRRQEDGETDISSEDYETGSDKEDTMKNGIIRGGGGEEGETSPSPGRRSRVIRLYQYDEDGQRYGHLQDPAPDEPGPTPMLKQRSLSLTRLNAIMAAASAGPLDIRETGRGERAEVPHFHMEI